MQPSSVATRLAALSALVRPTIVRRALLPLTVLLFPAGCASSGGPRGASTRPPTPPLHVRVDNHNWSDMVVYALQPSGRRRLGEVTAMNTRHFVLRPALDAPSGTLRLYAEPIGPGESYAAPPVAPAPGEQVMLVLKNNPSHSHVHLRR